MSVSLQQSLISARFLTTFGHFIALLTLFSTVEENVNLGLKDGYSQDEHRTAMTTAWAALIFAFMCFVLDFSGLFFGTSLFYVKVGSFPVSWDLFLNIISLMLGSCHSHILPLCWGNLSFMANHSPLELSCLMADCCELQSAHSSL